MSTKTIQAALALIAEHASVQKDTIRLDSRLCDIGVDSLDLLALKLDAEEQYGPFVHDGPDVRDVDMGTTVQALILFWLEAQCKMLSQG